MNRLSSISKHKQTIGTLSTKKKHARANTGSTIASSQSLLSMIPDAQLSEKTDP